MTPPLLEHPLIQKYFGYHRNGSTVGPYMVAWNVLRSMQQDFSIGEKYLSWDRWSGEVTGPHTLAKDIPAEPYKQDLKLQDRFQPPPEREKHCQGVCECGELLRHKDQPPSTAGCQCELDHRIMEHCRYECQCVCHAKPTPAPSAVEVLRSEILGEVCSSDFRKDYAREWLDKQLRELVALVRQEGKNV